MKEIITTNTNSSLH